MKIYLLELIITDPGRTVCEPLGIYSTMERAKKNLEKVMKAYPRSNSENIMLNIIDMDLNEEPPILNYKNFKYDLMAESLLELYNQGVFEQMVEPDGSFSYAITKEYQKGFEKLVSRIYNDKRNFKQ